MPRLLWPSWRWMTMSGTPSRAISTACAWRSWCGANRRRTPAAAAVRRSCARAAAVAQGSASRRPVDDAEQRTDGEVDAEVQPRLELSPAPVVHADLSALSALAAADEQRAASLIEVRLGERERFLDAQPGSPEDHDQSAQPAAVGRHRPLASPAMISSTFGGSAG